MAVSRGALAAALLTIGTTSVLGQDLVVTDEADETVVFQAEAVLRDDEASPIVATGNVRATFGGRLLTAERVVYDPATDVVTAYGSVAIYEADGTPFFADEVTLTGDLADGVATNFSALLDGDSRLGASSAVRRRDGRNELNNAVYTACEVCAADGDAKAPTWQIKALRVTQDTEDQVIRFRNAVIEVLGVPVFYTPYVQVPDPAVERQSGFLFPRIGNSTRRGIEAEVPYYLAISDHQDITFNPKFMSELGTLVQGEYRVRTHDAGAVIQAGLIGAEDGVPEAIPDLRGHVFASAFKDLPDGWRAQIDVNLTSDDDYLQFYDVEPEGSLQDGLDVIRPDRLVSEIAFTRRTDRSLTDISAISFQSQRSEDDDDFQADALPRITHQRDYDVLGGELTLLGNLLYLNRTAGLDTSRAVATATFERTHTTRGGHRFRGFAELRGDVYRFEEADQGVDGCNVSDVAGAPRVGFLDRFENCRLALPRDAEDDGFTTAHLLPTVGVEWSYPLAKTTEGATYIVEPRVQLVASPETDFGEDVFNEDGQFFQFDDVTLFDWTKGTGFDLYEDGQRVNVGLAGTAVYRNGLTVSGLVGQQYRLQKTDAFADDRPVFVRDPVTGVVVRDPETNEPLVARAVVNDTGLGDETSDFVGNLDIRYNANLALTNRFRFDKDDLTLDRGETTMRGRYGRLSGALSYLRVERQALGTAGERDEFLTASAAFELSDKWTIGGGFREDLDRGDATARNLLLRYRDQCTLITLNYREDNTRGLAFGTDRSILLDIDLLGF